MVTEIAACGADEMVLAFLASEVPAGRGADCVTTLRRNGWKADELIDHPDLRDPRQNAARAMLLTCLRGYLTRTRIFRGFPIDVVWTRASFDPSDVGAMRYANFRTWVDLSGGTRLVRVGAANVDTIPVGEDANRRVRAVAECVNAGATHPALIAVRAHGAHVLLEGHTRATAYVYAGVASPTDVILGHSDQIDRWRWL